MQNLAKIRDVDYIDLPTGHWPQFARARDPCERRPRLIARLAILLVVHPIVFIRQNGIHPQRIVTGLLWVQLTLSVGSLPSSCIRGR